MPTIQERIVAAIGGVTRTEFRTALDEAAVAAAKARRRAYEAGFRDAEDEPASGTTIRYGYRRASRYPRDFSGMAHEDMLNTVWTLWKSSPIAKRLLTLKRDHIIGRGIEPQSNDEELDKVLKSFWRRNKLAQRLTEFTLQLFLYGEQCFPAFVRESDGGVSLSYIDPSEIDAVILHPDNALETWAVAIGEETTGTAPKWSTEKKNQVYRLVREDNAVSVKKEDGTLITKPPQHEGRLVMHDQANLEDWEASLLAAYGLSKYTGSCFFAKVNSVSGQSRGVSDLLQSADWIDQADETLFSMADREQLAGYFAWIVKLLNVEGDELDERADEIRNSAPERGGVLVVNESEDWNFVSPDLKQPGTIAAFKALLGMILGGAGYPFHWFSFGDDANRATAVAQQDPTVKSMQHDQGIIADLIGDFCTFARDQAAIAGELKGESADATFTVTMPEIAQKDMQLIGTLLAPVTAAMISAVDRGLLTPETAVGILVSVLIDLGFDVDLSEELEKLEEIPDEDSTEGFEAWLRNLDVLQEKMRANGH